MEVFLFKALLTVLASNILVTHRSTFVTSSYIEPQSLNKCFIGIVKPDAYFTLISSTEVEDLDAPGCQELNIHGNRTHFLEFTKITQEARKSLKSISLSYTNFEIDVLLESLEGCVNLEILSLTDVSWNGGFFKKVHLPMLKSFTLVSWSEESFECPTNQNLASRIFFYKQSPNPQEDVELWRNVEILIGREFYIPDISITASDVSLRCMDDPSVLYYVSKSRNITKLSLYQTTLNGEHLVGLNHIKSLHLSMGHAYLVNAFVSDVVKNCAAAEEIQIDLGYMDAESVDVALIKPNALRILDLSRVSLRWSSTSKPTLLPLLEVFVLKSCDFIPSLIKFTSSLTRIELVNVGILEGTLQAMFSIEDSKLTKLELTDVVSGQNMDKIELDIALVPNQELTTLVLRYCEIICSRPISFEKFEYLDFDDVVIHDSLVRNFSNIFGAAKTMIFNQNVSPNLLIEILKTEVRHLEFRFDWNAQQTDEFHFIKNLLADLDVPEWPNSVISLKMPENESHFEYERVRKYEEDLLITVYVVILYSICGLGLIGNAISVMVLSRREMRKFSNSTYILLGLAVWDSLFIVTYIVQLLWVFGDNRFNLTTMYFQNISKCLVYPLNKTAYSGSVWLTLLLTIDRFIAISMPLKARSILTAGRTLKYVAIVCLFSTLLNFPRWIENYTMDYANDDRYWYFNQRPSIIAYEDYRIVYQLYLWAFFMYVIPFVSMVVLNMKIWFEIRRANTSRRRLAGQTIETETSVTKMLISVVILFLICNTINALMICLFLSSSVASNPAFFECIASQPLLINSAANFIIYFAMGTKFRSECVKLFSRIFKPCDLGKTLVRRGPPQSTISNAVCSDDIEITHF